MSQHFYDSDYGKKENADYGSYNELLSKETFLPCISAKRLFWENLTNSIILRATTGM